ncbi:YppG family protein [Sutcliffiella horikoshii]|uniref:YppG family protein n=1 Tax=Sutcliffiella horikoshii TaxID=79883 RepID=UPI0007D0499F|nr:YppG family protein [Sutcliffiella horikoshii]MCM3617320.1 YppG family protein [Sutcliffiella horikoshii]
MFRRMYGRPRHLSYNRNMSLFNQLPFLNNFLPNGNGGGMQGMFPQQYMDAGWMNQQGMPSNYMNMMPLTGGNASSSGFPFAMMNQMGQNPYSSNMQMGGGGQNGFQPNMAIGQNGFPMGMQMPGMPQGGGMPNQMGTPFMNPYPTQAQSTKTQTSQVNSFMNQFKGQDGNVDMKKMMDTAGQMMNTVNQLNSMFKGLAATFKA